MELDELIGEIRREAALRRAAPDFPLDLEAAVATDLDALGPVGVGGSGADLAAILARLRQLAAEAGPLAELSTLTASAVNAMTARLDHLQRRVGRVDRSRSASGWTGRDRDRSAGPGWAPAPRPEAIEALLVRPGPVVVLGPGAEAWVEALLAAGVDASGVDPTTEEFGDSGPVRSGPVLEYLVSVGDRSFAGVVLTGPLAAVEAPLLADLCAESARVADRVVVWSEAPWAWRLRLGEAEADKQAYRPLSPEAWLDGLAGAGMVATGSYGPEGSDYLLMASEPGDD